MNTTEFNAGPWTAETANNGSLDIYGKRGECLATIRNDNKQANAKLIAAAPELLELAQMFVYLNTDFIKTKQYLINKATKAIQKATA